MNRSYVFALFSLIFGNKASQKPLPYEPIDNPTSSNRNATRSSNRDHKVKRANRKRDKRAKRTRQQNRKK